MEVGGCSSGGVEEWSEGWGGGENLKLSAKARAYAFLLFPYGLKASISPTRCMMSYAGSRVTLDLRGAQSTCLSLFHTQDTRAWAYAFLLLMGEASTGRMGCVMSYINLQVTLDLQAP